MKFIVTAAIAASVLLGFATCISEHPILIVVSFDGFRWDFFNKNLNPHLTKLGEAGTRADYMRNVFPTKTFPNHYTMATGLYAENHGVIDGNFYDPEIDDIVTYGERYLNYDKDVVPIWRLNEDFESGRHSGVMMWTGGEFAFQGKHITYAHKWYLDFDYKKRVDIALSWIENPEKPANLVMIYIEQPDKFQHAFGPESEMVEKNLAVMDDVALYLAQQLKLKGLASVANVIFLSDHGLAPITPADIVDVPAMLPPGNNAFYKIAGSSVTMHITPDPGYEDYFYDLLTEASQSTGKFHVFRKRDLPERWRLKNCTRTPPIFLLAEKGNVFQFIRKDMDHYSKRFNFTVTNETVFGVHGYDPRVQDMRPFFLAYGPSVKVNATVAPFDNVDLYSLFCALLGIFPVVVRDGHFENVAEILAEYDGEDRSTYFLVQVLSFVGLSCVLIVFIVCIVYKIKKRRTKTRGKEKDQLGMDSVVT